MTVYMFLTSQIFTDKQSRPGGTELSNRPAASQRGSLGLLLVLRGWTPVAGDSGHWCPHFLLQSLQFNP